MYKLIACDLDETLLNSKSEICPRNVEAIKKLPKLGVKFIPASGRGYETIQSTLKQLDLFDKEDEYLISFNGGAITENKKNRLLQFHTLPFELAKKLFERGLSYDVCIHVYTKDTVYVYRFWDEEKAYIKGRMEMTEFFTDNLDFLEEANEDIVKVLYVNTDYEYLKSIERDLKELGLTQNVDVSYSSNRYIEFNPKGVTKGAALLSLADLLGVKPEETIAIGDNFNDLSMIRAAGLGVGVQNTISDMKPLCDYITEATNNEGAVGEVIEKFVLK